MYEIIYPSQADPHHLDSTSRFWVLLSVKKSSLSMPTRSSSRQWLATRSSPSLRQTSKSLSNDDSYRKHSFYVSFRFLSSEFLQSEVAARSWPSPQAKEARRSQR